MAYQGDDSAPLLPAFIKAWLKGWLYRASGYLVLLILLAGSVSLLTWSASDPSLSHATRGATRNLLGAPGAMLADMLMKGVGLGSVVCFLPPLFWAMQLLNGERVADWRVKLALAPLAVLLLAAALAAMPKAAAWQQMSNGMGGFIGNWMLTLLAGVLTAVNPARAHAAAGLFCFAAGMMTLLGCLGLSQRDLKLIWESSPRLRIAGVAALGARLRDMGPALYRAVPATAIPQGMPSEPRVEPTFEVHRQLVRPSPGRQAHAPADDLVATGRGPAFDDLTDEESRRIAERFAPGREGQVSMEESAGGDARMPATDLPREDVPRSRRVVERLRPNTDDLYERAIDIVLRDRKATTSHLGRRLSIDYAQAAEFIERMERERLIGPPAYNGQRHILVGNDSRAGHGW